MDQEETIKDQDLEESSRMEPEETTEEQALEESQRMEPEDTSEEQVLEESQRMEPEDTSDEQVLEESQRKEPEDTSEEQVLEESQRMEQEGTGLASEEPCLEDSAQGPNHSSTSSHQEAIDAAGASSCYICGKSTEEDGRLRKFSDKTWTTAKKIAALRKNLSSDKHFEITQKLLVSSDQEVTPNHHPSCYRKYTAVKRPKEPTAPDVDDEPTPKKVCIKTRRSSGLLKSNQQGLLKGSCIFCGKSRKKKNNKEEPRLKISTVDGCESLRQRAQSSKNERIKSLIRSGEDLIAKEAEYHKSCRVDFLTETKEQSMSPQSISTSHKRAFGSVLSYIKNEVIEKQQSVLIRDLFHMYKDEYIGLGGDGADLQAYTPQHLTRKIKDHLKEEVAIQVVDQRKGNFIYSPSVPEDVAKAQLHEDAERYEEEQKIKWAALHLRSQIMTLPKTKTPNPTTVPNLKECAPGIPAQLDLFFKTLLGGITPTFNGVQKDATDRKVTAMASDAIFNVTRGSVKPWKHTALGLGCASLTGSKLVLQILNRTGHCISYDDTKGLETEFAYSVESDSRDAPDGIRLDPNLATASVWDNNDANVETLDGKETLHATVGHTYQNVLQDDQEANANPMEFRDRKNRRKFVGSEREIPPFRRPIRTAQFPTTAATTDTSANTSESQVTDGEQNEFKIRLKVLDLYWFWKLREGKTPLHAGFMSKYVKDPLPLQRICYMDPISKSPTNNDVVRETMMRTMNIAQETGQGYAVVTYDLAVALKAYSIQAIETPLFDKLLIMLGNFHVELAFYGAVGTFINDSGIEFILTEADILAEGSMMGFVKGKFYNRCTRIHELLANVLEKKLYDRFILDIPEEDYNSFQQVMSTVPSDPRQAEEYLSDPIIAQHIQMYENYFQSVLDGHLGSTAKYWAIYIFLINRVHRELQRCVNTNDVNGYIQVFPMMLAVFFALNRPNYARWGTLFLQKLKTAKPELQEVLKKGAFSIRRTRKDYSRSAVDLSLEQTVNRDAASSGKGIVAFRNSENAMRRWSLTMTQRAMAVTELRSFAGLEVGETATTQCRPSRIKKDNQHMDALSKKIDEFCNPFADEAPASLVNVATGQAATKATESYLLNTLQRGQDDRDKFLQEWESDNSRFLKPVTRTRVQNFAAQNAKNKSKLPAAQKAKTSAESLRDMFVRMIIVVADKTALDLHNVLSHPITTFPLSLSHSDGAHVKTTKSALLQKLESLQTETITELPRSYAQVFDGGLLLHSVLSQTNSGSSYASIARTILSMVCSGRASEVHVCLDKYVENSIKDSERKLRGAVDTPYVITGPDQIMRQRGKILLNNGVFKNEFAKFLLKEWRKDHYWNIFGGKTLFASYGGECVQYVPDDDDHVAVNIPAKFQGDHEEADTLMAFHLSHIAAGNTIVRASDTDVLVILIGALGQQRREVRSTSSIIMDCGMGNSRRYINVTNITDILEERQAGLARALPGYHAFTGCDFTSAFYRRGKTKPLDLVEKDKTDQFVNLFISMGEVDGGVDPDVASEFVCNMYGQRKTRDVNEARYNKLVKMTGKVDQKNPLANIKRVDCALLPPCRQTLEMKIRRTQYVATLWIRAVTPFPGDGLSPIDYGWCVSDNLLKPTWFQGPAIPDSLFSNDSDHVEDMEVGDDTQSDMEEESTDELGAIISDGDVDIADELVIDSDGEAWSEDSDSEEEDEYV